MGTITANDGTEIFYKDWARGSRSCSAMAGRSMQTPGTTSRSSWRPTAFAPSRMTRRGHGRSSQPWTGNEMDTYADDLAELIETLDLEDVILVGHSTGGGEVTRHIGRHGTSRVAKAVLLGGIGETL